ncbi:ABC transporter ATP-binding protein [Bacteroides helcogenes]|uniref:ABC transporter related protein n=1 Tax=Bacteroides helcogenes (strain ATCC 35417 / DSM 20613 / JCM 6297 / CCUG 15421 / P 36-108) TaxID=693979 RepID=E6SP60_BACT6|nr:ABC transporter ATP-binding protein [Bacteroides helcogenes]ADV43830.1 ABC transporter related protein [Bacteroides helcogenes P 36-108]MDY5237461.1 ABC transporter ATP-binding protein [Bacteroides helcogenes]
MKEKQKKKGIARLFQIAGERKGLLVLASTLSALSAACMLVPYWAIYEILKELLCHSSDLSAVDGTWMIHWGWMAFIGLIGGLLFLYAALMSSHVAAFRILYGLRVRLSEHIGKLPLGYLNGTSTGAIKKTMEQNIEKIETFIAHTIPDLVNVVATVVVTFVIFFSLNGWLAVVCLTVVAVSLFLQFTNFMGKKAQEFTRIYFDAQEQMSASAVQYVRGMPVVKIFGQSVRSFRRFNAEIEAYKTYALKVCDTYQSGMMMFTVLLNSMVTFILPVGILMIQGTSGSIALAVVWLFFIILGPGMASPVYKLMYLGGSTREIDEGVERIDRIFDREPIPEPTCPKIPEKYDIEFRNVSFAYKDSKATTRTEALRNVSFTAGQREITALVGPSGSGKSTVANLIPRFWDIDSGEIRIGGINIKDIATEQLMNLVSFVFQDTFLFYDTLYENIAVGNPSATREDVTAAARAAQCHDFISNLPDGYNTRIGDKGIYLSGGEAQRVCVARAILKNAPILVLDEATAFADPENEYKMQQALQQLIKDKTVIIIAHRLSSIISANQIIVLKEGEIVQRGRHETLSTTEGVYKKMWDAYTSAFRWQLNTKNKEV